MAFYDQPFLLGFSFSVSHSKPPRVMFYRILSHNTHTFDSTFLIWSVYLSRSQIKLSVSSNMGVTRFLRWRRGERDRTGLPRCGKHHHQHTHTENIIIGKVQPRRKKLFFELRREWSRTRSIADELLNLKCTTRIWQIENREQKERTWLEER